jgi:hypothetical protein
MTAISDTQVALGLAVASGKAPQAVDALGSISSDAAP